MTPYAEHDIIRASDIADSQIIVMLNGVTQRLVTSAKSGQNGFVLRTKLDSGGNTITKVGDIDGIEHERILGHVEFFTP